MSQDSVCHPLSFEQRFEKRFERRFGRCGGRHDGLRHGLFFGGALILAGTLFLLQHVGALGGYTAWQFWPLLLVLSGIGHLVRRPRAWDWIWGSLLIGGGGLALAHTLALIHLPWAVIWPVGLVVLGLSLIIGLVVLVRWHARQVDRRKRNGK